MVISEPLDSVATSHVAKAGTPEAERINEGLTQDDLVVGTQSLDVPDASVGTGQIEVIRCFFPRRFADKPAVQLSELTLLIKNRN